MKTRLLSRVRYAAQRIFDTKLLTFGTVYGRVNRIRRTIGYDWAFMWMMDERLDYYADQKKIVCTIARLLWKRELCRYWYNKLKKGGAK